MARVRRPGLTPVLSVIAVTTAGVLPAFLAGGLAVQIRHDLHFGQSGIGFATAVAFGASAAGSAPFGRLADRIGSATGMRVAASVAALSMAGVAVLARSFHGLLAWLALSGLSNALAQPSSNAMIVERVRAGRRSLAFGIKQSAIPVATLLGGITVPLVALTVGWRWAFGGGACAAAAAAVLVPRADDAPRAERDRAGRPTLGPLLAMAAGAGLGAAAGGTLGAFATSSGVAFGLAAGTSGAVQAVGSAVSLAVRLSGGWLGDRRAAGHLAAVAVMLAAGAGGFALMATGRKFAFVLGVAIAYGGAWAWPGLFNFAVTRQYPDYPAMATGMTQTGVYIGAAAGPALFGVLVAGTSFRMAWIASAAVALAASAILVVARRR
jgi:MFS family permease